MSRIFILFAFLFVTVQQMPCAMAEEESTFTRREVADAQHALRFFGGYSGPIDGLFGPGTAEAVVRYQKKRGLPVDGKLSEALLEDLRYLYNKVIPPQPHNAPKKCRMYALQFWSPGAVGEFIGDHGGSGSVAVYPNRGWALEMYRRCSSACENESWWSRTFGECSH